MKFKHYLSLLLERSAVADYYLANPDKLKNMCITISKKAENTDIQRGIEFNFRNSREYEKLYNKKGKIYDEFKEIADKLKAEYNIVNPKDTWTSFRYFDDMEKYIDFKKANPRTSTPVFDKFAKDAQLYFSIEYIMRYYPKLYLEKMALQFGTKADVLEDALKEITKYRSMSGQKIDSGALDAIKAITVTHAPGKIYRGWFLDGEKLSKIKGIENLKEGDTFQFSFGKPSSWSTMKETAYSFAGSQDMVKDSKNGYMMVLSYTPSIDEVQADLRSPVLSFVTKYYNQQEIILENGKKTFTVEWISKGDDYQKINNQVHGSNGGSSSMSNRDIILATVQETSYNPALKKYINEFETAVKISSMLTADVIKKYPHLINYDFTDLEKKEPFRLVMLLARPFYDLSIIEKNGKDSFKVETKSREPKFWQYKIQLDVKISDYDVMFTKPKMKISNPIMISPEGEKMEVDKELLDLVTKSAKQYFNIS